VALVLGWINASEPPVIVSIVCSAASAIFMAMGLYRSRPPRRAKKAPKKPARAGRSGR
jgi:hypothetical protein